MSKELSATPFKDVEIYVKEIKEEIRPYVLLNGAELAEARTEITKIFNKYDKERISLGKQLNAYIKSQISPVIDLKEKADTAYEEVEKVRKREKLIEIMNYFKDNYSVFIPQWKLINDERWLNKTHTTWQKEIDDKISTIKKELILVETLKLDKENYFLDLDLDRLIEDSKLEIDVVQAEETRSTSDEVKEKTYHEGVVERFTFNVVVDEKSKKKLIEFLDNNKYNWA